MRKSMRKFVAVVLVLMMLVMMLPMGIVSVNAAVSDGLAVALADPNATEYVITSVEDWKAVAALNNLMGKTIKLGADIDAGGAALPKFTSFSGTTFDGCDFTVKNVSNTDALLTSMFYNNSTIKNLKLDKVSLTGTGKDVGLIVSAASFDSGNTSSVIENVIATDCAITATGATNVGGLIGRVSIPAGAISMKNLRISGSLTADDGNVGGLVGHIDTNVAMTIQGFHSELALTNNTQYKMTGSDYTHATGGAIGYLKAYQNTSKEITLRDMYIAGKLASSSNAIAGVVGYAEVKSGDLNLYNLAVNCAEYNVSADIYVRSVFANVKQAFNLNYENLYTNTGGYMGNTLKWYVVDLWMGHNYVSLNGSKDTFINNTFIYNNHKGVLNTFLAQHDGNNMGVEPIDLTKVVKVNGYEIIVMDHIYASAVQSSAVENGKFAVRFIALSQRMPITAFDVTMEIILTTTGGVKKRFVKTCTLYDKLTAYNEKGIGEARLASDYEAQKLAALTIYNIPANSGETVTFEVRTTYKAEDGKPVQGMHTMTVSYLNGQLVQ